MLYCIVNPILLYEFDQQINNLVNNIRYPNYKNIDDYIRYFNFVFNLIYNDIDLQLDSAELFNFIKENKIKTRDLFSDIILKYAKIKNIDLDISIVNKYYTYYVPYILLSEYNKLKILSLEYILYQYIICIQINSTYYFLYFNGCNNQKINVKYLYESKTDDFQKIDKQQSQTTCNILKTNTIFINKIPIRYSKNIKLFKIISQKSTFILKLLHLFGFNYLIYV